MADRYLIETSPTDGYLLEDGTGVLLMEVPSEGVGTGQVFIGLSPLQYYGVFTDLQL